MCKSAQFCFETNSPSLHRHIHARTPTGPELSIPPVGSPFSLRPAGKPQKHNVLNRMGYKGDGLKMRGNSSAMTEVVTITGSSRCLMPNGPLTTRLTGQLPTVNTLPIYRHSSLCNATQHKHAFVHWPLNNSARAKCYDTFLIKVSLSSRGGIFQTLCSSQLTKAPLLNMISKYKHDTT